MATVTSAREAPKSLVQRADRINPTRKVQWQHWPERGDVQYKPDELSLASDHPDLEDGSCITWGLEQSENAHGNPSVIDVLYGTGTNLEWPSAVNDERLSQILETKSHKLRVCFINTLAGQSSWLPGNFSLRPSTINILRKAGLSGILLSNLFSQQTYWAKMGNQRFIRYDEGGKVVSFEICYQYRCGWDTGVSFIHAKRSPQQTTYFCINYPSVAHDRLKAIFDHPKSRAILHRDFFFDTILADDSMKQWQIDIANRNVELQKLEKGQEERFEEASAKKAADTELSRSDQKPPRSLKEADLEARLGPLLTKDHVSPYSLQQWGPMAPKPEKSRKDANQKKYDEKSRKDDNQKKHEEFNKETRKLHKMVRHWLGLRQDCEDLLAQLRFLQETFLKIRDNRIDTWEVDRTVDPGEVFEALLSQCDICVRWTQVYHDRTQKCIDLLFHLANQEAAADTAKIAEQTRRDSASMITLAAVTMAFLPGTFVCTVVSTSFFDFSNEGVQVSRQWWILLAVAIPLTILVFAIWWFWQGMTSRLISRYQRTKERAKKEKGNIKGLWEKLLK